MNGIIFLELGKFAQSRIGDQAWRDVVWLAGVPPRIYYRVADYPDAEASALVTALAAALNESPGALLEDLGEFITPDLLRMARYWIQQQWKTLDLIEHTEATIHETLRAEGSRTDPPRRLCRLARGIIKGTANHYGEQAQITEPACMLNGEAACRLVVKCRPL